MPSHRRFLSAVTDSAMILILEPNTDPASPEYKSLVERLCALADVEFRVHREVGTEINLTELHLIGNTGVLQLEDIQSLPCVEKVVRVSEPYRVLGRHKTKDGLRDDRPTHFDYNGVRFGQDTFHVF